MTTRFFAAPLLTAMLLTLLAACNDDASYADLLRDENKYVNSYLADQRVCATIPADSIFEAGDDAPYYKMDDDGNIYMQVLDAGSRFKPTTDDRVYFRFTRYALNTYSTGVTMTGDGNSDDVSGENGLGARYFLLDNTDLASSVVFGSGIQVPMHYLGDGAHVRLVVKSQFGFTTDMGDVIPYLYDIRYFSSPLSPWKSIIAAGATDDTEELETY